MAERRPEGLGVYRFSMPSGNEYRNVPNV